METHDISNQWSILMGVRLDDSEKTFKTFTLTEIFALAELH